MFGLIGSKIGMTRIFNEENIAIPVTVIKIKPNYVTKIKTNKINGYSAIQVTTGEKKIKKINKSELGNFLKYNIKIGMGLWEFHVKEDEKFFLGQEMSIKLFIGVKIVDVTGVSKGKGFSGTVKRWNFKTQDATHGNSLSHRVPGSIGQNQSPGKVFKGKKMAGQLGRERVTVQNLNVVRVDLNKQILLLQGAVPGYSGSNLIIKFAIKN